MCDRVGPDKLNTTSIIRGILFAMLLAVAAFLATASMFPANAAFAEDATGDAATSDSRAVEAGETVIIGCLNAPSYGYLDDTGFPRGYDVEYAQEIAQYANLNSTYKMYDSVTDATVALEAGDIDMLIDCGKTDEREQRFIFSDYPLTMTSNQIMVRSGDDRFVYGNVVSLKDKTFGIVKDSIIRSQFVAWCTSNGFTPDVVLYDDVSKLGEALDSGQIDAIVSSYSLSDEYRVIFYFNPTSAYVMFAKSNTVLKSKIDTALAQMLIDDPFVNQRLTSKYLNANMNTIPEFTTEERAYIAQHPTLRVAVIKDDSPYFHIEDGQAKGILPDYYSAVAAKTGFIVEYVECDDQTAVKDAVRAGNADIVGFYGGDMLTAHNENLLRTDSYATQVGVQVTRANSEGEVKVAAVTQRRAAILKLELANSGKDIKLIPFANNDESYAALESGKVDAIFTTLATATWLANQHGSSNLEISAEPDISLDLSGAVAADNNTLCSIMNRVAVLSEADMQSAITNNSASADTLQSTIEKIPAGYIIGFAILMIVLVSGLIVALVLLIRRQKERSRILAEAAETEKQRVRLEAMAKSTDDKNQFFSNISHDMRTPLNAIIGFSQLAENEHASPAVDDYLSKINDSGNLLLGLINDTLTISKSGKGKLELQATPCLNSDIFNSVVVPIQKSADDRSIILTTDRTHMAERAILADRLNVQKIVLNLLSNAIKFTPSGKRVWFTMADDPEGSEDPDTLIIVRDEGIGIDREFQKHLYEPFSQELRTGYAGTGTGLGLAIVKEYVDLMGGTITCESEQGEGTTFTVRVHFPTAEMPAQEPTDILEPVDLSGHTVLLCEDNALNAEIARRLLESKGISVVYAENGHIGVEEFSNSRPGTYDAVLMDVRMPIMDGLTAARAIRALDRPDARTVPIIAMTADAFEEDIKRCFEAGMDGHVAKPIDPESLFVTLGANIARREKAAES